MTLNQDRSSRLGPPDPSASRPKTAYSMRSSLKRATDGGEASATELFTAAQVLKDAGDGRGSKSALSQILLLDPRHLAALLMMAEANAGEGDDRGAISYYRTALATASAQGASVTNEMIAKLRRGEHFLVEANRRFEEHLMASVSMRGSPARVRQAIDLLLGKSELYLQQPSMLYYPGLAQRPFFERDEFDWIPEFEASATEIQNELREILNNSEAFPPYVTGSPDRPTPANPLLNDSSWGAFHLLQQGEAVAGNAERCPVTMAALNRIPTPQIIGRSPMALFSLLRAGTHIRPHHGLLNTRLICHLPLAVPRGCKLRVGSETRVPVECETIIFDDSFEHEAWNDGDSTRVILLFEIWRPELSQDERDHLTQIFETIEKYDMGAVDMG